MNERKKTPATDGSDFESQFQELEQLIKSLEAGSLPLQDSLEHYARGQRLKENCMSMLKATQTRATALRKQDLEADVPGTSTDKFEAEMENLEKLVERLEQNNLSLADGLDTFEEGLALGRVLQRSLDKAEQSVQQLVGEQGAETLKPFVSKDVGRPGTG